MKPSEKYFKENSNCFGLAKQFDPDVYAELMVKEALEANIAAIRRLVKLRQKYIEAELKHYKETGEKSIKLRAKVSVLTELQNILKDK